MYIKIQVQWTYNDIHNNHSRYTLLKHKYNTNNINQKNQFTKYFR